MSTGIGSSMYLNLPVQDVAAARTFWADAGVDIAESYSDEKALALKFSEHVVVMLLQRDFFASFSSGRPIADPRAAVAASPCLDAATKQDVDAFVDAAVAAGAIEVPPPDPDPAQEMIDSGMMYGRTFTDPDGHQWEILWMSDQMPSE
jgi:predicted lactoylglutathione lyase